MVVNARTDPESGLRFYTWQQKDYPSVTSIRRLIGMPFTLHQWVLSRIIDRAVEQHDTITTMLEREAKPRERKRNENVTKEVRKFLRAAATEERDLAGDRGTRAHDAIASGLVPEDCAADIRGFVFQFRDFITTTGATVLWSERQIFNLRYGYAGTADLLIQFPNGRVVILDLKTSRGIYLDHAVQIIAYAMGEFVGENDRVDAGATKQLLSATGMAILHLYETEWEYVEVKADASLFAGFVGSLAFARFLHDNDNSIDPLVVSRNKGGTLVPALAASLRVIEGEAQHGND